MIYIRYLRLQNQPIDRKERKLDGSSNISRTKGAGRGVPAARDKYRRERTAENTGNKRKMKDVEFNVSTSS